MKILLIEPNAGVWAPGTYLRHSSVEPLGLQYVGAIAKLDGFDVKIIQQRAKPDAAILAEVQSFQPDVVGFSVMTYNYYAARNLARLIKQLNGKIKIVMGGSHPSAMPQITEDENIDFAVIGEGEETFRDLMNAIRNNTDCLNVNGIAFHDGEVQITNPRKRIATLDSLPWPMRSKEILEDCRIFGLNNPPASKQKSVAQVLYSRGCPYDCIFCASHRLWGKRVFFRSTKDVVAEIKNLESEFGTNYVYFADLLFNHSKEKVISLCDELIRGHVNSKWFCLCSVLNIEQDMVLRMKEAGCSRIGFGIDSIDDSILKRIKPRQKSASSKIENALNLSNNAGIINRAFFIIGYPWQSKNELLKVGAVLQALPIDELRIGILTPLPGSPIYDDFKKQGIIINEDFSKYTTEESAIQLKDMNADELDRIKQQIFKDFYQSPAYYKRMKDKIRRFPELKESFQVHIEFLKARGISIGL